MQTWVTNLHTALKRALAASLAFGLHLEHLALGPRPPAMIAAESLLRWCIRVAAALLLLGLFVLAVLLAVRLAAWLLLEIGRGLLFLL